MQIDKDTLQIIIGQHIPLSTQVGFTIQQLLPLAIKVKGDGKKNINIHGTAFAGSQYVIATLTSWGLLYSILPANSSLVMMEGKIKYIKPLVGEIFAECKLTTKKNQLFLQQLKEKDKVKITVTVNIQSINTNTSVFTADYYASIKHSSN